MGTAWAFLRGFRVCSEGGLLWVCAGARLALHRLGFRLMGNIVLWGVAQLKSWLPGKAEAGGDPISKARAIGRQAASVHHKSPGRRFFLPGLRSVWHWTTPHAPRSR